MGKAELPLKEISIEQLYNTAGVTNAVTYSIPIYQRNYAWKKDEIAAMVQDVYDAYSKDPQSIYYIGTLVTYHRGDQVYEVIDGQQRLTTIYLILQVMKIRPQSRLTYQARRKSNDTLRSIPAFEIDEKDEGITSGFMCAEDALREIVPENLEQAFRRYFCRQVHIVHYRVPNDVDLNHYFEVMNSRGEQLEKHEIIKARLISVLNTGTTSEERERDRQDRLKLRTIWECCSNMNVYLQQQFPEASAFGQNLDHFTADSFETIRLSEAEGHEQELTIAELIQQGGVGSSPKKGDSRDLDTFQPIIDFSNFLLIVLKLTRILSEKNFVPRDFNLDDKDLISEFEQISLDAGWVKNFGYTLLKARYYLDNYIVHHTNEEDTLERNPWMLQKWQKDGGKGYPKNLTEGNPEIQQKLVHLLSMFEVSFTARQRKNYLLYCLLHLFQQKPDQSGTPDTVEYCNFTERLADKYFRDVYLKKDCLNSSNMPLPGAFDEAILSAGKVCTEITNKNASFESIYGDGTEASRGISLFIFNYLDYRLWCFYAKHLRGENKEEGSKERKAFFNTLGCPDFGLKPFKLFYFSRTRSSLEHYFPQANAQKTEDLLNNDQINCFGNYARIGSEANSGASNWSPKTKLDHYLDPSGKIRQISVASLKFMIMMQICKHPASQRPLGQEWNFEDIQQHQKKMVDILMGN